MGRAMFMTFLQTSFISRRNNCCRRNEETTEEEKDCCEFSHDDLNLYFTVKV